jgi:flagellar basal-body rod modification protein FlgD
MAAAATTAATISALAESGKGRHMTIDTTSATGPKTFPAVPTYTGPQAPVSTPTTKSTLSKDDFLRLFVTQLKNQDPTSPLQPYELAAQLAQFTSVEQLTNLNNSLTQQLSAIAGSTLATQSSLGASLLGRQVVTAGNQVVVPASGQGSVVVDIGGAGGGNATLTVEDAAGNPLTSVPYGQVSSGRQTLALPALTPGTYQYGVSVKDPNGNDVPVTTYTTGVVDGLQFQNGNPVLQMGGITVPLDQLVEVKSAVSPSTSQESPIP